MCVLSCYIMLWTWGNQVTKIESDNYTKMLLLLMEEMLSQKWVFVLRYQNTRITTATAAAANISSSTTTALHELCDKHSYHNSLFRAATSLHKWKSLKGSKNCIIAVEFHTTLIKIKIHLKNAESNIFVCNKKLPAAVCLVIIKHVTNHITPWFILYSTNRLYSNTYIDCL